MRDVMHLAKWELIKLLKSKMAQLLIGLIVVIMIGITINEYNQYQVSKEKTVLEATEQFNAKWREREEFLIEQTESYMEDPYYTEIQKEAIRRRIEIAEYKLENNIPRSVYKNTWYFFSDNMFKAVSVIVTLFIAIVAAFSMAREYNERTLTQLLLLPYKRWKLLTAKYLSVFLYAGIYLATLIILGTLSGLIVYGFKGSGDMIILSSVTGPYVLSSFTYSVIVVVIKIVEMALMIFMAMMIAVLTKSSAVATIISSLMLILVMPLSIFAAGYSRVWHYTPFLNSDLRKYLEFGSVMPSVESYFTNNVAEGMNWIISLIIVIVYCILFGSISYYEFCKRDMK